MSPRRNRTTVGTFVLLVVVTVAIFAAGVQAMILPLRSGTVVSKMDSGAFTYIKAVDDAGKEFWILTSICTVGEKGKIAVLAGTHYDKLKTEHQGLIEDVYTAQLLKIGNLEVTGFGAHGLPAGCVMLD
jgi:hypothetical protein